MGVEEAYEGSRTASSIRMRVRYENGDAYEATVHFQKISKKRRSWYVFNAVHVSLNGSRRDVNGRPVTLPRGALDHMKDGVTEILELYDSSISEESEILSVATQLELLPVM